jgi:hypothetical protein
MSQPVKITELEILSFRTYADRFQAGTPRPRQELVQTLTSIETDPGVTGHDLGGGSDGDQEGEAIPERGLSRESKPRIAA